MKVPAARARGFAARPDPRAAGILIYGPETAEIDALRKTLTDALSADGEAPDITRMEAAEVRRDPAALSDALRASALFGGRPLVVLENAGDGLAGAIGAAMEGLAPGEAHLVVTAGGLAAKSKLRKLFEGGDTLAALPVYARALDRAALQEMLQAEGARLGEDAMARLEAFAEMAEAAELRGLVRTLGLLSLDGKPVDAATLEGLLPETVEGEVDAVVSATLSRSAEQALGALSRMGAAGGPASAVSALGRQFRQLHALTAAPDGPEQAVGRLRPPVFGPRRDLLLRAARAWPEAAAERALSMIADTELAVRATGGPPDRATAERLIVRLCMLRGR